MEQHNRLLDTTTTGAILILWFVLPSLILIPWDQLSTSSIGTIFLDEKNLLAKWVAVGVASHVLGSIITVCSISVIPRPYQNESSRRCLQFTILQWIDKFNIDHKNELDKQICREARQTLGKVDPDSIWAWVHYSDPRKELIEWGRRKLRYAYLGENWMFAMSLGLVTGAVFAVWNPGCTFRGGHAIIGLLFLILTGLSFWRLLVLRKRNIKWDNDMVAMYVAGRIWQGLEERFLPWSIKEKEIQDKPNYTGKS